MRDIRVVVLRARAAPSAPAPTSRTWRSSDGRSAAARSAIRSRSQPRLRHAAGDASTPLPKAVIALVEGAAMGGGFGLVAVSDWAIAREERAVGMPEVTVGVVPAQIAPFVAARIGYAQARRLATYGAARSSAADALRLGLVHEVADDRGDLRGDGRGRRQPACCAARRRRSPRPSAWCAPRSRRWQPLGRRRARLRPPRKFAAPAARSGARPREGIRAFVEKRSAPAWDRPQMPASCRSST